MITFCSYISKESSNTKLLGIQKINLLFPGGIPIKRSVMDVQIGAPFLSQESITELYPVPENTVGLVIGRGGTEIQGIQAQSGAKVQMCPDSDSSGFRQVTICGMRPNIEHAKQLIQEIVTRAQQRQAGGNAGIPQSVGGVTVDIQIPATKCGLIIGKQGETIKLLQEQSGCKMMMIQESQEITGMSKPLRITGDPSKIEFAKQLVADLMKEGRDNGGGGGYQPKFPMDPSMTAKGEVVVPRSSVGVIIGKSGETIKRLALETGTKIQFKPDEDKNSNERCAVIMGTREQIYKATELITELVKKSDPSAVNSAAGEQSVFIMIVPANKCGLVIGKGGETIKQINAECGAHCELNRETNSNPQVKEFIIRGSAYQIEHAQHLIAIKVGDVAPNTPFVSRNRVQPQAMQQQPQQQQQQFYQWNAQFPAQQMAPYAQGQQVAQNPYAQQAQNPQLAAQQQYQAQAAAQAQAAQMAQAQARVAQPQAAQAAAAPAVNAAGQPDYSAQWAEYYRSVGLADQAAMVEAQMKQRGAGAPAAAAVPQQAQPTMWRQ